MYASIYVIASDRGLEIGFSVTIHEDDYYNAAVKQRQRNIVPILNHKLPDPASQLVVDLDTALASDGVWKFGAKTRQLSGPDFGSVAKLIEHLKSPKSSNRGGGSIYRVIEPEQTVSPSFDFNATFFGALDRFTPLMRLLVPTNAENVRLEDQEIVDDVANQIPDFDPTNLEDGRKKVLQLVALRQGQAKFRDKLFDAYSGRCAVTGTSITATLQAAHIYPYFGPETNAVQNGLLLRADIHNLFDLGLMEIEPHTLLVHLVDELKITAYGKLDGKKIRVPKKAHERPSPLALTKKKEMLS